MLRSVILNVNKLMKVNLPKPKLLLDDVSGIELEELLDVESIISRKNYVND